MSEHQSAVDAALRTVKRLGVLFDRLGNGAQPDGFVVAAYREARKAIDLASIRSVRETLAFLRTSLAGDMRFLLAEAEVLADEQFASDARLYPELQVRATAPASGVGDVLRGWLSVFDSQANGILALLAMGQAGDELVLGDGGHVGLLSPGPLVQEGERWLVTAHGGRYGQHIEQATQATGTSFAKQAIAAIDENTTDCCLKVHGQVQPLDGLFELTGTPRFADRLPGPPFHGHCRTATALVRAATADDELTTQMREAAAAELAARVTTGTRVEIHPAHARSRRA